MARVRTASGAAMALLTPAPRPLATTPAPTVPAAAFLRNSRLLDFIVLIDLTPLCVWCSHRSPPCSEARPEGPCRGVYCLPSLALPRVSFLQLLAWRRLPPAPLDC